MGAELAERLNKDGFIVSQKTYIMRDAVRAADILRNHVRFRTIHFTAFPVYQIRILTDFLLIQCGVANQLLELALVHVCRLRGDVAYW